MTDINLKFIAGEFLRTRHVPKEKAYLKVYFGTRIQRMFLRYMLVFRDTRHFCTHTGYVTTVRNLQLMAKKLRDLEAAHAAAQAAMDLEGLERIQKGNYFRRRAT